jgi:hypothetical protein
MPKFENEEQDDNVKEPALEAPVEEVKRPFSDEDVAGWKAQFKELALIEIDQEDKDGNSVSYTQKLFVMRGIGREEFRNLDQGTYRNSQDYENKVVEQALVFPPLTELQLRGMDAGDVQTLYQQIPTLSNVGAGQEVRGVQFDPAVHGPLCEGTDAKDWKAWRAAAKDRGLFYVEFEGQPFIYKNLSRSQYETYRTKVDKSESDKETAEEMVCSEGVVFPFSDNFKPSTNQFMYGTISSLALAIMRQSGFGRAINVTKI